MLLWSSHFFGKGLTNQRVLQTKYSAFFELEDKTDYLNIDQDKYYLDQLPLYILQGMLTEAVDKRFNFSHLGFQENSQPSMVFSAAISQMSLQIQ